MPEPFGQCRLGVCKQSLSRVVTVSPVCHIATRLLTQPADMCEPWLQCLRKVMQKVASPCKMGLVMAAMPSER